MAIFSTFFNRLMNADISEKIRSHGRIIASAYDTCAVIAAWVITHQLLLNSINAISIRYIDHTFYWQLIFSDLVWILPVQFLLFRSSGLYRGFWRFASIQDLQKILSVSAIGGMIALIVLNANRTDFLPNIFVTNPLPINDFFAAEFLLLPPYIAAILYGIFLAGLLSFGRVVVRFLKDHKKLYDDCKRVIIIGAGNAGEGLVRDLLRDSYHRYKPVAFVDDDLHKLGREIHGVRVAGTIADLPKLIEKYAIDLALIAIPSASSANMRSVVDTCEKANVRCYTLPGIRNLANGHVSINVLRNVSLEDLLGRYPRTWQWELMKSHLQDKTILITGGGGSIGSELCRQIAIIANRARLVIIDNSEYNLYAIDLELRQKFANQEFYPILLNIVDRVGIKSVLKEYQPHLVFHAAAYKHVPLLQHQMRTAMYNNIIGTRVIATEAAKANVETFVLISSDKAVNPTNIMGATKRAAEYFCHNLNDSAPKTRFVTVRFGNVLDSAGSVVPLFRKQIESGGPVTVTHPEITRFFMTMPEASQLILQAAFLGEGGEIFVLDMGDPIKIRYLAEQMIKLAGKMVDQDINIIYTGLRPGEKLYEECFYSNEMLQPTHHTKILRAQSKRRNFQEIQDICDQIANCCQSDADVQADLEELLKKLVPEYQAEENTVIEGNGLQ